MSTLMQGTRRCRPAMTLCAATALRAAAVAALVSLGGPFQLDAADPNWDELPSYLSESSMTIAALVQDDGKAANDSDAVKPQLGDTTEDSTLRDALEMLSDDDPRSENTDDLASEVTNRSLFADRRTELVDGRLRLPPIKALTTNTAEIGNGEVPLGFRQGEVSPIVKLPESGVDRGLPWQWNARYWAAANTFSHPLYFEDRMLERHGHQLHPCLQPFLSGGRFAAQAAALPYLTAIAPPWECQYSLGYYRAGSCVPALKQRPPYQRKAAAAQVTAIAIGATIYP